MKILVTGATGFIGSNVAEKLRKDGHEVFCLIRKKEIDCKEKNIIEYDKDLDKLIQSFKNEKFDIVLHCAALFRAEHKSEDVDELINSNILLTAHILEAMKQSNVKKIINTLTSWQHYNDEEYNPVCLYAATKQASEDIIKFYCEAEDFSCINLVIYDSYGPDDKRKKLINLLFDIAGTTNNLDLSQGEQYVDYIYIDDIVDAYIQSLNFLIKNKMQGFNKYYLNSDNPLKLRDVVKICEEVLGKKMNINFGKRPYRLREVMDTYKKGQRLPNWYPKYTLKEGVEKIKNERNFK